MYGVLVFINLFVCEIINPKAQTPLQNPISDEKNVDNNSEKAEVERSKDEPVVPKDSENNPIQSITFSERGKPYLLVKLKNSADYSYGLYKSTSPNKPESFTWSHVIDSEDVELENNICKIRIPTLSEEEKKYVYCLAITENQNKSNECLHFSEPFEYCPSQKKYMLSRVAKDYKKSGGSSAAWIAIGVAIAALVIVVAFVLYRLIC